MTSLKRAGVQWMGQGGEVSLTPLDSFENSRLELLGEAGMHCPSLELLAFQCLEVV